MADISGMTWLSDSKGTENSSIHRISDNQIMLLPALPYKL